MLINPLPDIFMVTRLYTEDYFLNQMPGEGIPEMQRSNLVSTVIQVLDLLNSCHLVFFYKNSKVGRRYAKPHKFFLFTFSIK